MKQDFETASESDWEIASTREAILAPLLWKNESTESAVQRAASALKLSRAMVFRLLRRYRANPKTSTLLPVRRGRKEGCQLLDEKQEQLIAREIEDFYLTGERPSLAALHQRIALACRRAKVHPPSYKAVRSRVDLSDLKRRVELRQGRKAASDRFRLVGNGPKATQPLELVQIDHTLADVMIVDEVSRRAIRRPWISLAIDVATRVVPGFFISLDPPSSLSVALLISHAALPKEGFLRERGVDQEWPVQGLPGRLHMDNGKEFHAQALKKGCREYGIDVEYRPPLRPTYGAHIERLIGTMMGEVHLLPGTTSSSVADRGDYDSAGCATMTLKEFEIWFTWQVVGVYHQRIHSGLGMPPLHAWKLGLRKHPGAIRPVLDLKRFCIDFLPFELRKVRRDGVRLFNVHYCDTALAPMVARSNQKYAIKYDPRDLSHVYLKEPSGDFLKIPYRDLSRPPISLWEHRWATEELRRQGRLAINEDNLFAAIEAQRRLIEKAHLATQGARRKQLHRHMGDKTDTSRSKPSQRASKGVEIIGPVELYPCEVWE